MSLPVQNYSFPNLILFLDFLLNFFSGRGGAGGGGESPNMRTSKILLSKVTGENLHSVVPHGKNLFRGMTL